ncbi:class I adenylate-forming enzyme family protein [Mycolicibacterium palauense]|uniref:class I adenylate-forming enzyme family protein n=1 Tax=Mycolicibacterium palauense TaxID=2034511 RepID=UPI000BFEDDE0|nr:fatty acid--CoA ligase family protein [Mycolicibacterium palauense]
MPECFTEKLAASLAGYGDRPCLEFDGRWLSGDEFTAYGRAATDLLSRAGLGGDDPVGLVVRNRPAHASVITGLLAAGRRVSMIYSFQSPRAIARDIEALRLPAIIADEQDWSAPVQDAVARAGAAGLTLGADVATVDGLGRARHRGRSEPVGLDVLTSGTTGPPKRRAIPAAVLERTVYSVTGGQAGPEDPPELMYWPLGGIGGVCQLITGAFVGKPMVLLEKFSVEGWVRAVRNHRIRRSGVQPAALRMLVDADLDPADTASLEYVMCAAGPVDPHTRDEFEGKYGVPVLLAYGATEFAGSVCTWTPALYREYGATKRLSSGRVLPDTQVRIVGADGGAEVPTGEQGLLEARIPAISEEWIRTTDIASIDADGFITLHGRADGAINRGGFKILPETVRQVLITHPAVRDACVVGVPDHRLGEVPFAAAELRPGSTVSEGELKDLVRQSLPAHHVPVAIATLTELPRNSALKVSLPAVADLYRAPRSAEYQR